MNKNVAKKNLEEVFKLLDMTKTDFAKKAGLEKSQFSNFMSIPDFYFIGEKVNNRLKKNGLDLSKNPKITSMEFLLKQFEIEALKLLHNIVSELEELASDDECQHDLRDDFDFKNLENMESEIVEYCDYIKHDVIGVIENLDKKIKKNIKE